MEQAELETLQTQLNEKQGALNELIAEKEKEIKDFDTKIAAAVKKAEEEAKKRAAAQAAAAASAAQAAGGTTTTAAAATTSTYTSGSVSGDQIVATAMAYVGTPYVYGGSSPSGFDCSGFTSFVFRQYGISLSRSSSAQLYGGTAVSLSDIQPGDVEITQNYKDDTELALDEAKNAIKKVLEGAPEIELMPQNTHTRKLQHELVEQYNLKSISIGDEPNRRLKVIRK